jgi:hypothetical protein
VCVGICQHHTTSKLRIALLYGHLQEDPKLPHNTQLLLYWFRSQSCWIGRMEHTHPDIPLMDLSCSPIGLCPLSLKTCYKPVSLLFYLRMSRILHWTTWMSRWMVFTYATLLIILTISILHNPMDDVLMVETNRTQNSRLQTPLRVVSWSR